MLIKNNKCILNNDKWPSKINNVNITGKCRTEILSSDRENTSKNNLLKISFRF